MLFGSGGDEPFIKFCLGHDDLQNTFEDLLDAATMLERMQLCPLYSDTLGLHDIFKFS